MKPFEYALPQNVKEVFGLLNHPGAMVKAGGIDLLDLMKEGIVTPSRLVNIGSIKELHFVKKEKGELALGPNLTLHELSEDKDLKQIYRALAQAASSAATPQIRHQATMGGNLCQHSRCWYYRNSDFQTVSPQSTDLLARSGENQLHSIFANQDPKKSIGAHPSSLATALTALGAKVKITSAKGDREVALEKFYTIPGKNKPQANVLQDGEIITQITLPKLPSGFTSYYFKQEHKQTFDWPLAEVAVALQISGGVCQDGRIVLGAAAPIPWRSQEAEKVIRGQKITKELAKKAGEAAVKKATPLSKNAYKVTLFKTVVARTICWAAGIDPLK